MKRIIIILLIISIQMFELWAQRKEAPGNNYLYLSNDYYDVYFLTYDLTLEEMLVQTQIKEKIETVKNLKIFVLGHNFIKVVSYIGDIPETITTYEYDIDSRLIAQITYDTSMIPLSKIRYDYNDRNFLTTKISYKFYKNDFRTLKFESYDYIKDSVKTEEIIQEYQIDDSLAQGSILKSIHNKYQYYNYDKKQFSNVSELVKIKDTIKSDNNFVWIYDSKGRQTLYHETRYNDTTKKNYKIQKSTTYTDLLVTSTTTESIDDISNKVTKNEVYFDSKQRVIKELNYISDESNVNNLYLDKVLTRSYDSDDAWITDLNYLKEGTKDINYDKTFRTKTRLKDSADSELSYKNTFDIDSEIINNNESITKKWLFIEVFDKHSTNLGLIRYIEKNNSWDLLSKTIFGKKIENNGYNYEDDIQFTSGNQRNVKRKYNWEKILEKELAFDFDKQSNKYSFSSYESELTNISKYQIIKQKHSTWAEQNDNKMDSVSTIVTLKYLRLPISVENEQLLEINSIGYYDQAQKQVILNSNLLQTDNLLLVDYLGQLVTFNINSGIIDLNWLHTGVYFLKNQSGKFTDLKFIVAD